jgi:hypothetical protein
VVNKFGEISLSGRIFPDPDNMCLQNPRALYFLELQCLAAAAAGQGYPRLPGDFSVVRLNQPYPATVMPSLQGIRWVITKAIRWSSTRWGSSLGRIE